VNIKRDNFFNKYQLSALELKEIEGIGFANKHTKELRTQENFQKTLYHEIGHLIIVLHLIYSQKRDIEIEKVTVIQNDKCEGHIKYMKFPSLTDKFKNNEEEIVVSLGGIAAELIHFSEQTLENIISNSSSSDYEKALKLIKENTSYNSEKNKNELIDDYLKTSKNIIKENNDTFLLFCEALKINKTLT
jgi:ATP-dependent Zn protease